MAITLSHAPGSYDRTIRITVTSSDPTHKIEVGFGDIPTTDREGVGSVWIPAIRSGKLYVVENYGAMALYDFTIESSNTVKYITLDNGLQFKVEAFIEASSIFTPETYKIDDNKIIKAI